MRAYRMTLGRKVVKNMHICANLLILLIGLLTPIFCYCIVPGISIINDPLSRFGIEENTKVVWLGFIITMALSLLFFGKAANMKIANLSHRTQLNLILYTAIVSFILSGIIDMSIRMTHLVFACVFFLFYVIYIIIFGIYSEQYRILRYAILLGLVNVLFLIPTFTLGISFGIFEIVFICSVIFWNFILNFSNFK
jgi:hypothetical protein